jgi:hypothetical protein
MDYFYDNSLQTGLMRDLAVDLELLGEHLVLLGNQVRKLVLECFTFVLTYYPAGSGEKQDSRSVSLHGSHPWRTSHCNILIDYVK